MKPIQKGLAIIAGATLITVLAISFLGGDSKNGEQKDVVEADAQVETKDAQGVAATDQAAANAVEAGVAEVEKQGEGSPAAVVTGASSTLNPVAAEAESAKDESSAQQNEAVSTSDAPAPPGPFHKNTMAGTPTMPPAPEAPTSENVDLPPPPMPQALIDAPATPTAPEANISKPEFVAKPEMNSAAPEQPASADISSKAEATAQDVPVETVVPAEAVANPAVAVQVEKGSEEVPVEAVAAPATETTTSTEAPVSMQTPPVTMPEKPSAPKIPVEIQQSGVNVQSQPMQQHQQPRVIFVPVPVYPYQQPQMNQQWGGQAPKMNFMPPQPPVMGEMAPAQGQ